MPFSTNTVQHAAGIVNKSVRQLVSTSATAEDTVFTHGFVPTYVCLMNVTDRVRMEWWAGMTLGSFVKTAANGTVTLETSGGFEVAETDAQALAGDRGLGSVLAKAAALVASKTFRLIAEG